MLHVAPLTDSLAYPSSKALSPRHAVLFAQARARRADLALARHVADESLRHLRRFMERDAGRTGCFGVMLARHRRDREALFEAMRRLDEAMTALRLAEPEAQEAGRDW